MVMWRRRRESIVELRFAANAECSLATSTRHRGQLGGGLVFLSIHCARTLLYEISHLRIRSIRGLKLFLFIDIPLWNNKTFPKRGRPTQPLRPSGRTLQKPTPTASTTSNHKIHHQQNSLSKSHTYATTSSTFVTHTLHHIQPATTPPHSPALPPEDQLLFDPEKPVNHALLLTKLTKSLMLNFLEMITVLGSDPAEAWRED